MQGVAFADLTLHVGLGTFRPITVDTIEEGKMTKDLAILIGPDQSWMTTEQFFEAVRVNLENKMATWA